MDQFRQTRLVESSAIDAERDFESAWKYANTIMQDVNPARADFSLMWGIHFYEYYQMNGGIDDVGLQWTIDEQHQKLDDMRERSGLPIEFEIVHEDDELPRKKGFRAKIFRWILSVERAGGIVDEDRTE